MRTSILLLILLLHVSSVSAETLTLKNGRQVTGNIIEKSDKSVKIDVNGVPMTYYADEIASQGESAAPTSSAEAQSPLATESQPGAAVGGSKRELILKFINVFGTRAAMTQNLTDMINSLPQDNPQTQAMKDKIKIDEIIDRLVPIYDKQFSEEQLRAYISFYSSDYGRKLIEGIGVVMRESMAVSTQYFQEKFPETNETKENGGQELR